MPSPLALQPANTADGSVSASSTVWETVRGATTGTAYSTGIVLYEIGTARKSGATYYLTRAFFTFDTSSIPSGSVITAAVLSLWFDYRSSSTKTMCVVQGTQGDTLENDDFNNVGSADWSNRVAMSALSTSAENQWTLNADGLAGVTAAGTTYLAMRSADKDLDNSAPADNYYADAYSSNFSTTTKRPKLTVTYTEGGGTTTVPVWLLQHRSIGIGLGGPHA